MADEQRPVPDDTDPMEDPIEAWLEIDDLDGDDFVEINLRQPAEVAGKLLVLVAVARRGYLEQRQREVEADETVNEEKKQTDYEAADAERFDLNHWLAEEKLTAWADEFELEALQTAIGDLSYEDAVDATWSIEAAAALAWALGKIPNFPRFDTPIDAATVIGTIPEPWSRTTEFRNAATLRPEEDIARVREQAELWADRADSYRWQFAGLLVEDADPPVDPSIMDDLESAIADTAAEAHAAGLLPPLQEGDFPTRYGPYRKLTADQVEELEVLAHQRLHALNWLCGLVEE